MIAALFVETSGSYYNLPGVDPWDEVRDARKYPGPYPVVAHPPCQRWGKMWMGSPSYVARTGIRKKKGDDKGCFKSALESVRKYGGVLEHPWQSHAWPHFSLNVPSKKGGWIKADDVGGWTCCVEQGRYGHYARKPTLLYAVGCTLPELDFGIGEHRIPQWAIDKYGLKRAKKIGELSFKGGGTDSSPRIGTPHIPRIVNINGQERKMTKNEDLKALTVYDELFSLIESQTGKVLLHSEMNDIINVVEKYSTRPTVTPADGDAERALAEYDKGFKHGSDFADWWDDNGKTIIQAAREHQKVCRDYAGLVKQTIEQQTEITNIRAALQSTRKPPVDTINIKREVLQGVREALSYLLNPRKLSVEGVLEQYKAEERAQEAIASLDAVLSEGE